MSLPIWIAGLARVGISGWKEACLVALAGALAGAGGMLGLGFWRGRHPPQAAPGPPAQPGAPDGAGLEVSVAPSPDPEVEAHAQRMEALGILAGGLAHDFNNLLGAMAGNVELAKLELSHGHPGATITPYLETLQALVQRSTRLVKQVLTASGQGRHESVSLDLNQQVEEMTRLMRASLSRKPALRLLTAPGLPPIKGELAQIQQVVMKLVLDASEPLEPEQGLITIRTGTEQLDQATIATEFQGQDLEPGLHVFLSVTDNGSGLRSEDREPAPGPLSLETLPHQGLGRTAMLDILREHRGGILMHRGPGLGTYFKLLFPVAELPHQGPPPPAALPFEEALGAYQGKGTVLVVDDEDPLRAMAVRALQIIGFDTLEARDGLEALQVFEANQDSIRLVLMDLTMPRMDGEEAYRVLRRSGILVPVILSSGFSETDVLQYFHGRGIAGFLQKPYQLQALLARVRQALEVEDWSGTKRVRDPLPWSPDMETGIPLLDYQHHCLHRAYNALVEGMRLEQPEGELERAFLVLKETALAHFGTEDALMGRCAFRGRKEHQAQHTLLIAQVSHLADRIHARELAFTPPVMDFLEGWLVHHMQEEDGRLARFLQSQGH